MSKTSVVALGRGEVRLAESEAHQSDVAPVLGPANCLGTAEEFVVQNELEYREKRSVDSLTAVKKMLTRNDLHVDFTIVEASRENLNLLLSGNLSDSDFFVGGEGFSTSYRVEVVFVYPDGATTLTLVLPKCRLTETSDLNLVNLSEPSKPAFTFQGLPVNNTAWGKRLGRVEIS